MLRRWLGLGLVLACSLAASIQVSSSPLGSAEPRPAGENTPQSECYHGICEHRLENGLKVLLFPDPSQAQMLVNITYLVGSRHENYGETGMAHLLEHLMFKGTPNIPDLDKEADRRGFSWNGTTSVDRTNYYSLFDANEEYLDFALRMEADRMVNSNIAASDLASEMTVVRNEMEQGDTQPFQVAISTLMGLAYQWHNYGKSTIGARSDVENVPIENLQRFYRLWYQPDNAVLLVAGPIDRERVLAQVHQYFGAIPRPQQPRPSHYTLEPAQDGARLASVYRPGTSTLLLGGYHWSPLAHPDTVAGELLMDILGNSTSGRLRKALVEKGLAAATGAAVMSRRERSMGLVYAQLSQEQDWSVAEGKLLEVSESIAASPITNEEFERARLNRRNEFKQQLDSVAGLGLALSEYIAAGDWRLFFWSQSVLERLSIADVQRVAERYLVTSNRSMVRFLPGKIEKTAIPEPLAPKEWLAALPPDPGTDVLAAFPNDPESIAKHVERFEPRPGLVLWLVPKASRNQAVQISGVMRIGNTIDLEGRAAALSAAVAMLTRGAGEWARVEFEDALSKAESELYFGRGADRVFIGGRSTRAHLAQWTKLLATALRKPRFDEQEFNQWRTQVLASLERASDDPQSQASNIFSQLTDPYPQGHPLSARDFGRQRQELQDLELGLVKQLHQTHFGADELHIAVVGDVDRDQWVAEMKAHFSDWRATRAPEVIERRAETGAPQERVLNLPEKANAVLAAGTEFAMSARDRDYPAMVMADFVLGSGGMSSRLMRRIRQQEGLSYGVSSSLVADQQFPVTNWSVFAIAAPENLAKVEALVFEELERLQTEGLSDDELATAKQAWLKTRRVTLSDDGSIAQSLAQLGFDHRTLGDASALEAKVLALEAAQVNAVLRVRMNPTQWHRVRVGTLPKATP